jgi:hypothetical protein
MGPRKDGASSDGRCRFALVQRLLWSCEGISHSRDWTANLGSHDSGVESDSRFRRSSSCSGCIN